MPLSSATAVPAITALPKAMIGPNGKDSHTSVKRLATTHVTMETAEPIPAPKAHPATRSGVISRTP
jgi:hypothetical protein